MQDRGHRASSAAFLARLPRCPFDFLGRPSQHHLFDALGVNATGETTSYVAGEMRRDLPTHGVEARLIMTASGVSSMMRQTPVAASSARMCDRSRTDDASHQVLTGGLR
jgi:hypothetical protein